MLTYDIELTAADLENASWLVMGGRQRAWRTVLVPALFVGCLAFWIAATFFEHRWGPLAVGVFVAAMALACLRANWMRRIGAHYRSDSIAKLLGVRRMVLADEGIDSFSSVQRSWFAWPLVTKVHVDAEYAVFATVSGLMLVLPLRAVSDQRALMAFLRARIPAKLPPGA